MKIALLAMLGCRQYENGDGLAFENGPILNDGGLREPGKRVFAELLPDGLGGMNIELAFLHVKGQCYEGRPAALVICFQDRYIARCSAKKAFVWKPQEMWGWGLVP